MSVTSVSNSLTTAGQVGNVFELADGQSGTYDLSGTFVGTLILQRSVGKGGWETVVSATGASSGSLVNRTSKGQLYRWRAQVMTSGTAVCALAPVTTDALSDVRHPVTNALLLRYRDDGVEIPALVGTHDASGATVTGGTPTTADGVGAKNGATVTAVEQGNGVIHKTVLTLAATPITLTDDAGVGQFGGVKLYDFPAGNIKVLGIVIDADLTLTETEWVDTAEGDVACGSGVPADGTALDGTAVDLLASTAIAALVAQVGPINAQSLADVVPLGSAAGTDDDLNLNVRIDDNAAHITGGGTITGTVTVTWMNLGDIA